MRVRLTTVIRWRGLVREGQPAGGFEVPDDEATQLALTRGWVERVRRPARKAEAHEPGAG